jgi:deazaflavin-dependent oxidoreductase (nitroreductase family)
MSKSIVSREQATRHRALFGRLTHLLNPFILTRAGNRLSSFAVIHHRGRSSGRAYTTPVSARQAADGFVIPLTFGKRADWFQNIQAAGGCVIQWKGAKYAVIEPEVIDRAAARSAFSPLERILLPLIGVEQFVHMRYAPTSEEDYGRVV